MELRQIVYFLKIAEYENITQAAEVLHVSQPPLTRQLQALEAELGVKLFVREKKRLHITEAGRFFRQQAEQILMLADKTVEQVRQMGEGRIGTLYIGSIETAGPALLPTWLEGFKARWPDVRYNLWSGNSDDVIERLEKGLVDLALIREPFNGEKFESVHIMDEPWTALVRTDHALSSAESLTLAQLAGEELIVPSRRSAEIAQWFSEAGMDTNIVCQYAPLVNGIILAERGLGVTICPASASDMLSGRSLVMRPLADVPTSGVALIWQRAAHLSAPARKFIDYIKTLQTIP